MQLKLNLAIAAVVVSALSVNAVPVPGRDTNDLAARSTAEDLAYLEARYAPEVDYESYFAREVVAPEPAEVLTRRDSASRLMEAMTTPNQADLAFNSETGIYEMLKVCHGLSDKKTRKKCRKTVHVIAKTYRSLMWGLPHYLEISGLSAFPPEIAKSLKLDLTDMKPSKPEDADPTAAAAAAAAPPPPDAAAAGGAAPPPADAPPSGGPTPGEPHKHKGHKKAPGPSDAAGPGGNPGAPPTPGPKEAGPPGAGPKGPKEAAGPAGAVPPGGPTGGPVGPAGAAPPPPHRRR